eukprot:CFRG3754T1
MASALFANVAQNAANKRSRSMDPNQQPWVEKYRPKSIDEVMYQEEVTAVLRKSLSSNDFPHLMFYGPPGTGKTSTILAIARELFGPKLMKERVLELNASDERGIQVVREKIKNFAQIAVGGTKAKGYPSPPFKIIILDEADSMTTDAQSALRRTMELHSKVTRFCLICNYVTRIIEPLTSRCAKFRFRPLPTEAMMKQISIVVDKEDITIADDVPAALVTSSGGDMRRVLNLLQSGHRWRGAEGIEASDITDISGRVPRQVVENILKVCQTNNYTSVRQMCTDIVLEGYSVSSLLDQLSDLLGEDNTMTNMQRCTMAFKLSQADKCLVDGADESLTLLDLCTSMMLSLAS